MGFTGLNSILHHSSLQSKICALVDTSTFYQYFSLYRWTCIPQNRAYGGLVLTWFSRPDLQQVPQNVHGLLEVDRFFFRFALNHQHWRKTNRQVLCGHLVSGRLRHDQSQMVHYVRQSGLCGGTEKTTQGYVMIIHGRLRFTTVVKIVYFYKFIGVIWTNKI